MKTRFLDNLSPFHTAHRNFDVPHRPDYCMTYYAWYMTRHAWSSSLAQWSARTVIDHQMFGNCAKYVLIKCHNMFGSMRCVLVGLAVKLLTSIVTFSCWCIGVLLYIVHTHTHTHTYHIHKSTLLNLPKIMRQITVRAGYFTCHFSPNLTSLGGGAVQPAATVK